MKEAEDVFPPHGVERFADVKLEEEGRSLALLKTSREISHIHEVIVDTSSLNECALGMRDKVVHEGGES